MGLEEQLSKDLKEIRKSLACQDHAEALRLIDLVKTYSEKAERPKDFSELEQDAYRIGIQNKLVQAIQLDKLNELQGAQKIINLLEVYAERGNIELPQKAIELKKSVYQKGMWSEFKRALREEDQGNYPQAQGFLKMSEYCATNAGIALPAEIAGLKQRIDEILQGDKRLLKKYSKSKESEILQDIYWQSGDPQSPIGNMLIYCRLGDQFTYKISDFVSGSHEEGYTKNMLSIIKNLNPDSVDILLINSSKDVREKLEKIKEAYKELWTKTHSHK